MKRKLLLLNGDVVMGTCDMPGGDWEITVESYWVSGAKASGMPTKGDVIYVPTTAVAWWV